MMRRRTPRAARGLPALAALLAVGALVACGRRANAPNSPEDGGRADVTAPANVADLDAAAGARGAPDAGTGGPTGDGPVAHADVEGTGEPTTRGPLAHEDVEGPPIDDFEVRSGPPKANAEVLGRATAERLTFDDLGKPRSPSSVRLSFVATGSFVRVPHCASRTRIRVDGNDVAAPLRGPVVVPLAGDGPHTVDMDSEVSTYEKRIACGERPRVGHRVVRTTGLSTLAFESPRRATHAKDGAGRAVVFVPPDHDASRPAALLVGVHPWNGSAWTYAAYRELLERAAARDVVLLMPSGLGNSLYTADAEEEVMLAIRELAKALPIDDARISLWGASMGGAGATTIGFHRPDRFAGVTSYFGDARYDLGSYVRGVLGGEAGAHRVNALDVVENARHLPVRLIHGEKDTTSKIEQSAILEAAMRERGFAVRFDRVPGMGHEGPLVVKFIAQVVDDAASARRNMHPARVSFRSVRPEDREAYGVRLSRSGSGDAVFDVEARDGTIVVHRAAGLGGLTFTPGALGIAPAHLESALRSADFEPGAKRVPLVVAAP